MEATKAAFGRLDMISNIAGATTFTHQDTLVTTIDADLWDRIIAINVRSAMLTCKHGIPLMLARGGGAICNTSSGLSFLGDDNSLAYGVGKAGVNTFTKYVATQFGKQGIRSNAVAPGLILTPAARAMMPQPFLDVIEMQTLVPRLGDPQDIANAHKFLLSDEAAFINGEVLSVDGGHRAHQPHTGQIRTLLGEMQG
jgi:NAD(P)-dependent dehydrogenase (short-subunit alcohol dehydrogenase family)